MEGSDFMNLTANTELAPHLYDALKSVFLMYSDGHFNEIVNTFKRLPAEVRASMLQKAGNLLYGQDSEMESLIKGSEVIMNVVTTLFFGIGVPLAGYGIFSTLKSDKEDLDE